MIKKSRWYGLHCRIFACDGCEYALSKDGGGSWLPPPLFFFFSLSLAACPLSLCTYVQMWVGEWLCNEYANAVKYKPGASNHCKASQGAACSRYHPPAHHCTPLHITAHTFAAVNNHAYCRHSITAVSNHTYPVTPSHTSTASLVSRCQWRWTNPEACTHELTETYTVYSTAHTRMGVACACLQGWAERNTVVIVRGRQGIPPLQRVARMPWSACGGR